MLVVISIETPTGGAVNFITGAGGFLQAVLFGFSGMRLKDEGLMLNAVLPDNVTQIKYSKV
jgi:trehalose/maltose hydrolase-like predicted phosphorylase